MIGFLFLLSLLGIFFLFIKKDKDNLPPGPWGLPLVGHFLFLGLDPAPVLQKWKRKYGPIIHCRIGSFPAVLLCNSKLIKEAFKMVELSGRPDFHILDQNGAKKGLGFSEGSHHAELRQFTSAAFKELGIGRKSFGGEIQMGVSDLLTFIKSVEGLPVNSEEIPRSHILRTLWSIMMTQQVSAEETQRMHKTIEDKIGNFTSVAAELAYVMPWLDKLVHFLTFGQVSLTRARIEGMLELSSYIDGHLQEKKKSWVKGQGQGQGQGQPRDLMDSFLQKVEETTDVHSIFHPSQNSTKTYLTDLFFGGLYTNHSSIAWTFYYLAAYPSVQKKLQEEVDLALGNSLKLPILDDRDQMPYAEMSVLELLRISSTAPFLSPHKALEDVSFHGYTIKKGTLVFGDAYGVHHDQEIWGDPEVFRPERWQGEQGQKLKRDHFLPFSTGRRSCLADRLVLDQLFLYVTSLCQRYNLELFGEESKGVHGVYGLTIHPSDFRLVFTPRQKYS